LLVVTFWQSLDGGELMVPWLMFPPATMLVGYVETRRRSWMTHCLAVVVIAPVLLLVLATPLLRSELVRALSLAYTVSATVAALILAIWLSRDESSNVGDSLNIDARRLRLRDVVAGSAESVAGGIEALLKPALVAVSVVVVVGLGICRS